MSISVGSIWTNGTIVQLKSFVEIFPQVVIPGGIGFKDSSSQCFSFWCKTTFAPVNFLISAADQYVHHYWSNSERFIHISFTGWNIYTDMYFDNWFDLRSMAGGDHGIAQPDFISPRTFDWIRCLLHALLWNNGGFTTGCRVAERLHGWIYGAGFVWGSSYDSDRLCISNISYFTAEMAGQRNRAVDKINDLIRNA